MSGRRSAVPVAGGIAAGLATILLALPVTGLLIRTPWSTAWSQLSSPELRDAIVLSLVTATITAGLATVVGVPLAHVLARATFRGRALVRAAVMLPLVLPPVAGGVALLLALGRNGVVGRWLHEWFGLTLPFTTAAVVVAQLFVSLPFLVITVEAGIRALDPRYERAAASLGAGRWRTFLLVTVPMTRTSILAGAALCWARAVGELGATITFAGNVPGRTQTMPLAILLALEQRPEGAVLLSVVLLGVSAAVLLLLRDRWLPAVAGGDR